MRQFLSVLAGVTLMVFSTWQIVSEARQTFSPLDQVDASVDMLSDEASTAASPWVSMPSDTAAQDAMLMEMLEGAALIAQHQDTNVEEAAFPPEGLVPEHIIIPAIQLDAPIEAVQTKDVRYMGEDYEQWITPKNAVGWHATSALLGLTGNSVFNGHHNMGGKVFARLAFLRPGDAIYIRSGEYVFAYEVISVMLLPEKYATLEQRLDNARWINPSADERITLVTCWPEQSNTHRVVVVALPVR